MNFRLNNFLFFCGCIITGLILFGAGLSANIYQQTQSDSTITDTAQTPANTFSHVDVVITYAWNPEEPERFENVKCQLMMDNNIIKELKIFFKDHTDCYEISKGNMKYEIRDHESKKLVKKGP